MTERSLPNGADIKASSFCGAGAGCVEVVPVENRKGEQEYLLRSDLGPKGTEGNVEIFTQKEFNMLVTEAATAPGFAESRFTQAPQSNGEAKFHLNSAGIQAGERPVFTGAEVRSAAGKITGAAREMATQPPRPLVAARTR